MLKTLRDQQMWLVSQPDHAELAGLLAANWGNDEFARPGQFASADDPEQLRAETVLAIAQHDNGWWEWEATPELSEVDGLPLDLRDVLKNRQAAMNRWRLGIPRFSRDHPYASLLISFHAYWLYAQGISNRPGPCFCSSAVLERFVNETLWGRDSRLLAVFLARSKEMQDAFITRLRKDQTCAAWIDRDHLNPHARLLQLLDGLSLSLCSALIPPRTGTAKGFGDDEFDLLDVPRRSWEDRVTINVKPAGEGRIVCEPYPFGVDLLPVVVPARILDWPADPSAHFQSWWYSEPKQSIRFEYCSG